MHMFYYEDWVWGIYSRVERGVYCNISSRCLISKFLVSSAINGADPSIYKMMEVEKLQCERLQRIVQYDTATRVSTSPHMITHRCVLISVCFHHHQVALFQDTGQSRTLNDPSGTECLVVARGSDGTARHTSKSAAPPLSRQVHYHLGPQ